MFGFVALLNLRSYVFISIVVAAILLVFVIFDTSHQMANLVYYTGGNTQGVLGPFIVGFITTPLVWALTDSFGAIVAGVLWPLAAIWLGFFVFLFIFSFIAPFFGWTLDWGRIFDL